MGAKRTALRLIDLETVRFTGAVHFGHPTNNRCLVGAKKMLRSWVTCLNVFLFVDATCIFLHLAARILVDHVYKFE